MRVRLNIENKCCLIFFITKQHSQFNCIEIWSHFHLSRMDINSSPTFFPEIQFTKAKNECRLAWNPSGRYIAIANNQILSIFSFPTENTIETVLVMNPFYQQISTISWCSSYDKDGYTPANILICSNEYFLVYNITDEKIKAKCIMENDTKIISSNWSLENSKLFYIGDSSGNVYCYKLLDENENNNEKNNHMEYMSFCKVMWCKKLNFVPNFLELSQFDDKYLLVASKNGNFVIINARDGCLTDFNGMFPIDDGILCDCRFYPFLKDTLLFVASFGIYIYPLNSGALIRLISSEISQGSIINVAFDETSESSLAFIHNSYIREYMVTKQGFVRGSNFQYLTKPVVSHNPLLGEARSKNKIAILSVGGWLQFFKFENKKLNQLMVHKILPESPKDYDVLDSILLTGDKFGGITIVENNKVLKSLKLFQGKVLKVSWLDKNKFIAIGTNEKHQVNAYLYNLETLKSLSLLKSSIIIMETNEIDLIISKNRKYFAIIFSNNTIFLFQDENNFTTIFESTPVLVAFSDIYDEEIITLSSKWIAKKYLLSPSEETKYTLFKTSKFSNNIVKPTHIKTIEDNLIIGTKFGDIIVINWFEEKIIKIPVLKKKINSIEVFGSIILIKDISNAIGLIKYENGKFEIFDVKGSKFAKKVKWFDENNLIIQKPSQSSLSIISSEKFQPLKIKKKIFKVNQEELLEKIKKETNLTKICQIASDAGYDILSTILSSLSSTIFSPKCLCANFSVERIRDFLDIINSMLGKSHRDFLKIKKIRLEILLGNQENAMNLLLSSQQDSPNFVVDVMKGALFNSKNSNQIVSPIVAALIDGNKVSDAIDILLITGQFREAARVLLSTGDVEEVIEIAKTRMDPEEHELTLNDLIQTLQINNNFIQAASILMTCHKFEEASDILKKEGHDFISKVVRSICFENGLIKFNLP